MKKLLFVVVVCVMALAVGCSARVGTPANLQYASGVLTWDAVAGAVCYEVEKDGQSVAVVQDAFCSVSVNTVSVFRVRAYADAEGKKVSDYSAPYTYIPAATTLPSMASPSIVDVNGQGLLSWTTVLGATSYRIWQNNSILCEVTGTTYTLSFDADGTYRYQVQTMGNASYADSPRSGTYAVTVEGGVVVAPRLRAVEISFDSADASIYWRAVPNAVLYSVWQNDSATVVAADAATDGLYRYSLRLDSAQTSVYVVAIADPQLYRNSVESNILSFPIQADPPPTDLHCEVRQDSVYLVWNSVVHCLSYQVKIESQDGVQYLDTPYPRLGLQLPDGTYNVSVRGVGNGMLYCDTQYSQQYQLTLVDGALPPVRLQAPTGLTMVEYTLRFEAVPNATGYQIAVSTPYEEVAAQSYVTVDTPSYTLPAALYESIVYLSVRALGGEGYLNSDSSAEICYMPAYYFYDGQLAMRSCLPTPALRLQNGVLYWGNIAGAVGYELIVDGLSVVGDIHQYSLQDKEGRVVCKVRALADEADDNSKNSPFGPEMAVTMPIRLATPTNLHISGGVLAWDEVVGAAGYLLDVGETTFSLTAASIDLTRILTIDGLYNLRVAALPSAAWQQRSLYSTTVDFTVDYQEEGTVDKPYPLASSADWAQLAQYPTKAFALQQDITLQGGCLFDNDHPFGGVLDGKGHTLTVYVDTADGFMGALYGATICNLTIRVTTPATTEGASLLALNAYNCVFQSIDWQCAAVSSGSLYTISNSSGCLYRQCRFDVQYSAVGRAAGLAGQSGQDTFDQVVMLGSVQGSGAVGALCADVVGSTVTGLQVGGDAPFVMQCANGNVGSMAQGSVLSFDGQVNLSVGGGGVCSMGALGGDVTARSATGTYRLQADIQCDVLFAGGLVGSGGVADGQVEVGLVLQGAVQRGYIGGFVGFANGAAACSDTSTVDVNVNLTMAHGSVCGAAGLGVCTYAGWPTGTVCVGSDVTVALRNVGADQDVEWDAWVVQRN